MDLEPSVHVNVWVLNARVTEGVLMLLEGLGHYEVEAAAGTNTYRRIRHIHHFLLITSTHWMSLCRRAMLFQNHHSDKLLGKLDINL